MWTPVPPLNLAVSASDGCLSLRVRVFARSRLCAVYPARCAPASARFSSVTRRASCACASNVQVVADVRECVCCLSAGALCMFIVPVPPSRWTISLAAPACATLCAVIECLSSLRAVEMAHEGHTHWRLTAWHVVHTSPTPSPGGAWGVCAARLQPSLRSFRPAGHVSRAAAGRCLIPRRCCPADVVCARCCAARAQQTVTV